jgi:hypothetical protein
MQINRNEKVNRWKLFVFNPVIQDPHVFHSLINHEKSRVDRDGIGFSLVVCEFSSGFIPRIIRKVIAGQLLLGMRSIDEIGWLNDHQLGVLLPSTSLEGGYRYAHRVRNSGTEDDGHLSFRVYAYPGPWFTNFREEFGFNAAPDHASLP